MELTGRREQFCREYLIDLNATQAAKRAGYTSDPNSEGGRLMAADEVRERIAELAGPRNAKLGLDAETVLIEILRLLTANLADALNEADGTAKRIHAMPIDTQRAIASIKVQETFEGSGAERVWTGYLKEIKFWNKEKAIEMAARHLSLFNDKLKVEGLDELAQKIVAARGRGAAEDPLL